MTIAEFVQNRGITEVLHYTTNSGLTGIIAQRAIKCRNLLREDDYLEHIYKQACVDRRLDRPYHGYVNLSLSRINAGLFNIASGNWHRDIDGYWCIFSIRPEILNHDSVIFTTTNNIYPSVCRGKGLRGLESMFSESVSGRYGSTISRRVETPASFPTCPQAEVLYPNELSLDYVETIYFKSGEDADAARGAFDACSVPPVPCVVNGAKFQ
ncbi:MAG: DarT ssDNA thymidine ADP-ribosyltransferase family protein [Planctomycetota bacterium]